MRTIIEQCPYGEHGCLFVGTQLRDGDVPGRIQQSQADDSLMREPEKLRKDEFVLIVGNLID